jgi:hypothetical protein
MSDWIEIMKEADKIASQLLQRKVDLAEAEKVLTYYVYRDCISDDVGQYLHEMAQNPPPRSRRSQAHFRNLEAIWINWHTRLEREDKARAWGWAVRNARITLQ